MSEQQSNSENNIKYIPVQIIEDYKTFDSNQNGQIDNLLVLIRTNLKQILILTSVFFIIGFLFAYTSENEYTSNTTILPDLQNSGSNLGRFSNLVRQIGIGSVSDQSGNDLMPAVVYADIVRSNVFLEEIVLSTIYDEEVGDSVLVHEYLRTSIKPNPIIKYTLGLPGVIINSFKEAVVDSSTIIEGVNYIKYSGSFLSSIRRLRSNLSIERDLMNGLVKISFISGDRSASVQILNLILNKLKKYVQEYRTENAKQSLEFLIKREEEAYKKYQASHVELAKFRDNNKGNLTARTEIDLRNLENKFNLTFNIYSGISEQTEQARIKLENDTPIINIIDEPIYPNNKSGPNRLFILLIYTLFGATIGVFWYSIIPSFTQEKS